MKLGISGLLQPKTSAKFLNFIRRERTFLSVLFVALASTSAPASAQEIWMWAGPHISHRGTGWEWVRRDAGDMWEPDASWATAANHVQVVGFVPPNLERATDGDLKLAFDDLKRRHAAIAISIGLIAKSDRPETRNW